MSGPILLIGGHEDRVGDRVVLRAVARECRKGPLVLLTAASREPERYLSMYAEAFGPLGTEVVELQLLDRRAADAPKAMLDHAGAVFITGGAQRRGAETLRDSVTARQLRERWLDGMPVAGTSAGAALLGEWMPGPEVERGLGLLAGVLVDQHLAQRGRTPRLLAVSALEGVLGIGVDEDTAAVVRDRALQVVGSGVVTIVDTIRATARRSTAGVSIRDATVHVVTADDEPFELPAG